MANDTEMTYDFILRYALEEDYSFYLISDISILGS